MASLWHSANVRILQGPATAAPPLIDVETSMGDISNRILLQNYYLPGDLEANIEAFVADYNHRRYHESIGNLTPADVYFGRGQAILIERERIKRQTIASRRLMHRQQAA